MSAKLHIVAVYFSVLCIMNSASAQVAFPPVQESEIRRIKAEWTSQAPRIDGKVDDSAWKTSNWSEPFVDLISGQPTIHDTRVKLLWDEDNLYVAYQIEEPLVTARFTERDSPIYRDNDVELFVAGEDAYYEFEINAFGTVYEGLFVWQSNYEKSGLSKIPELDRSLPEVRCQRFNGVGFKKHPRGLRWAFLDWDFPNSESAVSVLGTLNDNSDRDRGWTVELAFPWKEFAILDKSNPRPLPPRPGNEWRIDFSRFNQYKEAPRENLEGERIRDSGGWALSPHGVWDSHIPECFPFVEFVKAQNEEGK